MFLMCLLPETSSSFFFFFKGICIWLSVLFNGAPKKVTACGRRWVPVKKATRKGLASVHKAIAPDRGTGGSDERKEHCDWDSRGRRQEGAELDLKAGSRT